jgi:hypothetical protein
VIIEWPRQTAECVHTNIYYPRLPSDWSVSELAISHSLWESMGFRSPSFWVRSDPLYKIHILAAFPCIKRSEYVPKSVKGAKPSDTIQTLTDPKTWSAFHLFPDWLGLPILVGGNSSKRCHDTYAINWQRYLNGCTASWMLCGLKWMMTSWNEVARDTESTPLVRLHWIQPPTSFTYQHLPCISLGLETSSSLNCFPESWCTTLKIKVSHLVSSGLAVYSSILSDTCRICSAPAEPDQPLFHPCKCSGTIRYIHQDWSVTAFLSRIIRLDIVSIQSDYMARP